MRMTVTKAKKFIKACDKLIEEYKGEPEGYASHCVWECPLCDTGENDWINDWIRDVNCMVCPWVLFEGHECDEGDIHYADISNKDRLPRLRGWKVRLNNIIKKGGLK